MNKFVIFFPVKKKENIITGGERLLREIVDYINLKTGISCYEINLSAIPLIFKKYSCMINPWLFGYIFWRRPRFLVVDGRPYSMTALALCAIRLFTNTRIIVIYQASYYQEERSFRYFRRFLLKLVMSAAHFYMANSIIMQRALINEFKISGELIKIVNPGYNLRADLSKKKTNNHTSELPWNILCVTRIEPRKGISTLLQAVSQVSEKYPFFLNIIGNVPNKDEPGRSYYEELLEAVKRLGISHLVNFKGFIPEYELDDFYVNADFFVYPAKMEAFGIVLLEAMSYGLPVITTDVITPEITGEGQFASVVPVGDSIALTKTIETFMENPELYDRYRKASYDLIKRNDWSWERCGREFVDKFLK